MADGEDLVVAGEEEAHNQWSMDKEYSEDSSLRLLHLAKVLSPAMLLNSSLVNLLSPELEPTTPTLHEPKINHVPAECLNPKLQTLPREHTKISRMGNTSVQSVQTKSYPIREFGAARLAGLFYISRV